VFFQCCLLVACSKRAYLSLGVCANSLVFVFDQVVKFEIPITLSACFTVECLMTELRKNYL
jgi:hypothetical protein